MGLAHGVPGTWMPATSFTTAMRERAFEPDQRSSARVRARRTRRSSKGLFCWFRATWIEQFHGLSWTVSLLPSAATRESRCCGLKPRNWIMARSPRMAETCAAASGMKMAR